MVTSRLIKVLLLVTGVLTFVALAHFLLQLSHPRSPFVQTLDAAQKITLQIGSGKLELNREGSNWTVGTGSGGEHFRADATGKIAMMLGQLKALQVEDEIADRADRASEYQVDAASGIQVSVYGTNGNLLAEGILGKQVQDYTHIYFKYPNKPSVYLARGATRRDLEDIQVNSWRDKTLLDVPEDHVEAVYIEGPGFKTPLVRSSDTWSSNGKILDPTPIWGMIGVLAHLKTEEYIDLTQHPELSARREVV